MNLIYFQQVIRNYQVEAAMIDPKNANYAVTLRLFPS
ncbi:hypothetical protein VIRA109638_02840 [Vibrio rarus]